MSEPPGRTHGAADGAGGAKQSREELGVMNGFAGLRVLALESRRAPELAKLIKTYGGQPIVAPAIREVALESNKEALAFAAGLLAGDFDMVIFLTGVGARALLGFVETSYRREEYIAALQRVKIVARGPKPVAALRELAVTPSITVPEPNTWREILRALDEAGNSAVELRLRGARGARVTRVPVYRWALPEDLAPLRAAVKALAGGEIDVALFTTGVQVAHLFQVAAEMHLKESVRHGFHHTLVASIGPTTSEELLRRGIRADLEPSHPKMGFLVKETAEQAAELLRRKRLRSASA